MGPTDISVANWLEVIRAEDHEIPNLHPLVPQAKDLGFWDLLTIEAFAMLAEVECLKRARSRRLGILEATSVWTLNMMGVAVPICLAATLRGLSFLLPMIRGL